MTQHLFQRIYTKHTPPSKYVNNSDGGYFFYLYPYNRGRTFSNHKSAIRR